MLKEKVKENKKAPNHGNLGHVYELAFHIVPSVGDDKVNDVFEEIKKILQKNKAKIISESMPSLLNLEYQMEKTIDSIKHKYNTAYFSWIFFDDGNIEKIHEEIKSNNFVLRYLLIRDSRGSIIESSEVANLLDENDFERKNKKEELPDEQENIDLKNTEEETAEEDKTIEEEKEESLEEVDKAIDELIK
jgi:ribosomal protein S6